MLGLLAILSLPFALLSDLLEQMVAKVRFLHMRVSSLLINLERWSLYAFHTVRVEASHSLLHARVRYGTLGIAHCVLPVRTVWYLELAVSRGLPGRRTG